MALAILWSFAEEERRKKELNVSRRAMRDASNPLTLSDREFVAQFRLSKTAFGELCREVIPLLQAPKRKTKIRDELKVLAALSFYGGGSYQRSVASSFTHNMSQPALSNCLEEVTNALNNEAVLKKYINFPTSRQRREDIMTDFMILTGMPGTIGCIDCTHIAIKRPVGHGEDYYNRKNYHSLNVLVICDRYLNIMHIDASYGGAASDSYIWEESEVKPYMEQLQLNEERCWLLGDSGFPQREYLMTPILRAAQNTPEANYTNIHCSTHNLVKRCIWVMKARWRCLLHHTAALTIRAIMHSRKDKIIKNYRRASRRSVVTDINKIFDRWCDFTRYRDIFFSRTQYSNHYRFAAQLYNFRHIESTFNKNLEKTKNDPMYKLTQTPSKRSTKRQLVNVGFVEQEDEENCIFFNPNDLYCNEELSPSIDRRSNAVEMPIDLCEDDGDKETDYPEKEDENRSILFLETIHINEKEQKKNNNLSACLDQGLNTEYDNLEISIDPYENSDDNKDKDYNPEEDLNSSPLSDKTICLEEKEQTENRFLKSAQAKAPLQHCEITRCFSRAFSSCIKCSCLLCLDHFDSKQLNICEKHNPYTAETDHITLPLEKENNKNSINSFSINNYNSRSAKESGATNKNSDIENTDNNCEYIDCKEEVFSTSGKCICFLCYDHFISETSYNDCQNHISLQKKSQTKVKKGILKTQRKKTEKNTSVTKKNTTQINRDITQTDVDISQINRDVTQTDTYILHTSKDKTESNKGWTKKGNPRKRRKIEESLTERKTKKIKTEVEKLTVKAPCQKTCKKKCTQNFNDEDRKIINNEYISLTWETKGHYIKSLVTTKEVACRKVTKDEKPKRTINYVYNFFKDKIKVEVCKTFFLTTLGYNAKNDKRLMLALNRPIDNQKNQRGKYDRTTKCDRELIKGHIMKFNPVISHYRREHAPNRLYLPSDITITLMHQHFCKSYPQEVASFEVYRKVVRKEMNISFAHLGNEECEICAEFKEHHESHAATDKDCDFCQLFQKHKSKYNEARKSYKKDVNESENSKTTIYYSIDLQKVVMLPRMEQFKRAIFCPRIIAFNESFVPLGNSKKGMNIPFAAVWNESVSGRKQEDIISTINAFLIHKRDADQIVLWMDNCCAQNKNWTLFSFLVYIINSNHINAKKITLKYFEPGHTFMSADSFHHQVEQALQRKQKVYDFTDFIDAVQQANSKKTYVKSMEVSDFVNYIDLSSQHKLRKREPRVYLKNIMMITANRGEYQLKYKSNHNDEEEQCLDFLQTKIIKSNIFPAFEKKVSPRGILKSTKNEIIIKLLNLMPDNRRKFWLDLPVSECITNIE